MKCHGFFCAFENYFIELFANNQACLTEIRAFYWCAFSCKKYKVKIIIQFVSDFY